jgi:hypothetical protein
MASTNKSLAHNNKNHIEMRFMRLVAAAAENRG